MIRLATKDDVTRCAAIAAVANANHGDRSLAGFDEDHVESLFSRLADNGTLVVAEHDGELVGLLPCIASTAWRDPVAEMLFALMVWVHPHHRGKGIGAAMLDKARESGLPVMIAGRCNDEDRVGGMCQRAGFERYEQIWIGGA